jgi:hypothetical protein
MPRRRVARAVLLLCGLAALLVAGGASGALVRVNGIVLHADGGFQPQQLPRHQFAPISFHGFFEVNAQGGGRPATLEEAVLNFDRDGRLSAGGLPVCAPARVTDLGPAAARQACAGAVVGTGKIEALVEFDGGVVPVSSPLTIFNGPPEAGHPTVVLHSRNPDPAQKTLAIIVPIEKQRGEFRYRAVLKMPPIAGGRGTITRVEAEIGRRFQVGGQARSYVSAHCSDGILRTRGRFTFADGTVIDGAVEKGCLAL